MPLDSGEGADSIMGAKVGGPEGGRPGLESLLNAGADIGQALRALREAKGLSLQDISQVTCVRRAYLQAIEQMDLDLLPTGPFAVGYVRAYAEVLGVSSKLAVAKFREHAPSSQEDLKAPSGIAKQRDPRLSWLAGVCAVVIVSVVMWNLAQHAVAHDGRPTPPTPVTNAAPRAPLAAKGPVALGAAQPAPAVSPAATVRLVRSGSCPAAPMHRTIGLIQQKNSQPVSLPTGVCAVSSGPCAWPFKITLKAWGSDTSMVSPGTLAGARNDSPAASWRAK